MSKMAVLRKTPVVGQILAFLAGAPVAFDELGAVTAAEKRAWIQAREIAKTQGKGDALFYLFRHGTVDRNQMLLAGVAKTGKAALGMAKENTPGRVVALPLGKCAHCGHHYPDEHRARWGQSLRLCSDPSCIAANMDAWKRKKGDRMERKIFREGSPEEDWVALNNGSTKAQPYPLTAKARQYRELTEAELHHALGDALAARDAMATHDTHAENWYADDVHTILAELRRRGAHVGGRAVKQARGNGKSMWRHTLTSPARHGCQPVRIYFGQARPYTTDVITTGDTVLRNGEVLVFFATDPAGNAHFVSEDTWAARETELRAQLENLRLRHATPNGRKARPNSDEYHTSAGRARRVQHPRRPGYFQVYGDAEELDSRIAEDERRARILRDREAQAALQEEMAASRGRPRRKPSKSKPKGKKPVSSRDRKKLARPNSKVINVQLFDAPNKPLLHYRHDMVGGTQEDPELAWRGHTVWRSVRPGTTLIWGPVARGGFAPMRKAYRVEGEVAILVPLARGDYSALQRAFYDHEQDRLVFRDGRADKELEAVVRRVYGEVPS